jgi:Uma2 family endonuclease
MPMASVEHVEQRFILDGLDWTAYDSLLRAVGDRRVFVTYNRGQVELMSPSWEHDSRAEAINLLIRIIAEELEVPIKGGGSTTFRREDLDRGLEPDKCFYIRNEARVRRKKKIDLSIDPPPDLCVEVEISSRLLNRTEIYAQLGVPELWRDDGRHVRVFTLQSDGTYQEQDRSPSFPAVPLTQVDTLLSDFGAVDDTTWTRSARGYEHT